MTHDGIVDILMVTYNRAEYTSKSLPRLLDSCDDRMRVWVWHNGNDAETLDVVQSFRSHRAFYQFYHSPENKRLREPTNWFWQNSTGDYVSKIDDDNLMPEGWGQFLRAAHHADERLGVIGCWSFLKEDVDEKLAEKKVRTFGGGHRIMENCWVAGTGYLMKRACFERMGPIREGQSFPQYCIQLALRGWINGYYYPFIYMENLDDPRHPQTKLKTEEDFVAHRGLSARQFGVASLEQLTRRQSMIALDLQKASTDPRVYVGWRRRLRRMVQKLRFVRR